MFLRILLITSLIGSAALSSPGQDVPKAEVFGGYSWTGSSLQGVGASVTGSVNKWFGVTGDFSGHYGNEQVSGIRLYKSAHTIQGGPRFSVRRKRITAFAHALFGATRSKQSATIDDTYIEESSTEFSSTYGGGLDVAVSPRIAIRAIQLDYFRMGFFGTTDNRLRASAGVVFRFGRK